MHIEEWYIPFIFTTSFIFYYKFLAIYSTTNTFQNDTQLKYNVKREIFLICKNNHPCKKKVTEKLFSKDQLCLHHEMNLQGSSFNLKIQHWYHILKASFPCVKQQCLQRDQYTRITVHDKSEAPKQLDGWEAYFWKIYDIFENIWAPNATIFLNLVLRLIILNRQVLQLNVLCNCTNVV